VVEGEIDLELDLMGEMGEVTMEEVDEVGEAADANNRKENRVRG
jgi:hypothetical protein